MCGRFLLISDTDTFYPRFKVKEKVYEIIPNYNIAPGATTPIVVNDQENKIIKMRWGLVPFWAKDTKIGYKMINTRAETIQLKPSFSHSFKTMRCLVPASGFYEWKKEDEQKVPYLYRRKDGQLFAMAGIYDKWMQPDGEFLITFSIITTDPNALIAPIHDRMPVILSEENEQKWINKETVIDNLNMMLGSYSQKDFEIYQVSNEVNNPANNFADLIKLV